MKILAILFIIIFMVLIFGYADINITFNDKKIKITDKTIYKIIGSFIGAIVLSLIIGLPLLGIISLF